MKETKEFEQVRVHARSLESLYVVTFKVDGDRQKIGLAGVGDECPASFDMLNGGALLGQGPGKVVVDGASHDDTPVVV